MSDTKSLIERRAAIVKKAEAYHAKHEDNWDAEHDRTFRAMLNDAQELKAQIAQKERALKTISALAEAGDGGEIIGGPGRGKRWQSEQGRGYVCLASNEKLSQQSGFEPVVQHGVGETIRGMVAPHSQYVQPEVMATLGSNTSSTGSRMLDGELASGVIDLARSKARIIQAGAQTLVMKSSEMRIAKVTSGPAMQVKFENELFDDAEMTFGGIVLYPFTIGAHITFSRELASDAANFGSVIEDQLSRSLAVALDRYAIQGTGAQEPLGLTVNEDIDDTGTDSVGALDFGDVALAARKVREANHEPNAVLLDVGVSDDLFITKDNYGRWLGPPPTLADKPFLSTTNCPLSFGIVGDFTRCVWGIREEAFVEVSSVAGELFKRHQIAAKIVFRGDFAVTDASAFHRLAGITLT